MTIVTKALGFVKVRWALLPILLFSGSHCWNNNLRWEEHADMESTSGRSFVDAWERLDIRRLTMSSNSDYTDEWAMKCKLRRRPRAQNKHLVAISHQDICSMYRCSCRTSHSSRSVLPQDSGFPSASTLLLPLFCTTRASAHSPHHADNTAANTYMSARRRTNRTRTNTRKGNTKNRKEKIMRERQPWKEKN